MAELAEAWGWTEREVDEAVWYNVPKYLTLVRRQRAKRLQDELMVAKVQGDGVQKMFSQLKKQLEEPKDQDERLTEADGLEKRAVAAESLGDLVGAKTMRDRAGYLRSVVKRGLDLG